MAFAAKLREQVQHATKDSHFHVADAKRGTQSISSTVCGEDDIWTRAMYVQSRRPSETTSISSTTCGEDDIWASQPWNRWNSHRQPSKHDPLQFRTLMLLPSIDQIFPNGFDLDEDETSDTDSSVDEEDTWSLEGDLESEAPAKFSRAPSENDATDQAKWCDDWSDCSDLSDGSIEFIDVLHPTAMMDLPEISDLESDFSEGSTFASESPN